MRQGMFSIDTFGECSIPGWTDEEPQCGWAAPLFETAEAYDILARQNQVRPGSAWYDRTTDEFRFCFDEGEPERYGGIDVEIGRGTLRLYAIGSGSWIWEEAED